MNTVSTAVNVATMSAILFVSASILYAVFSVAFNATLNWRKAMAESKGAGSSEKLEPVLKVPDGLMVQELAGGKATLFVRNRPNQNLATGHMVVWSGKGKSPWQDSYYDLGTVSVQSGGFGNQLVAEFYKAAAHQLRVKADNLDAQSITLPPEPQVQTPAAPASSVVAESAIKLKKTPSVFRGTVLEVGMMPRASDGREFTCFGVRYRTAEGVEDVVWGVNLKTALRDAKAGIGDCVEILKIGRKTMEEGRAPMNLYKVTKI